MAADTSVTTPTNITNPAQRQAAADRAAYIQEHWADTAQAYAQAVIEEDWKVLEYVSLEEWAADVLGPGHLALEARQQVAAVLFAGGKTVREIARATGTAKSTAQRDLSQSGTTPSEQAKRDESVTRKPKAKTGAQRMRTSRQRKRQQQSRPVEDVHLPGEGGKRQERDSALAAHVPDCQCGPCVASRPPTASALAVHPDGCWCGACPPRTAPQEPAWAVLPADELGRLREQARKDLTEELRAEFQRRVDAQAARVNSQAVRVAELEEENAGLRAEVGRLEAERDELEKQLEARRQQAPAQHNGSGAADPWSLEISPAVDSPGVQVTTQDSQPERLCCRCGGAPVVYRVVPHRVGLCGPCYLENLGLVPGPELAATA